jgi:hypothetical protein
MNPNLNPGQTTKRSILLTMALAMVASLAFFAPRAAAAAQNPTKGVPVSGSYAGGTFTGTLDVNEFQVQEGVLYAVGDVTGTLVDTAGNAVGTVAAVPVLLPVLNGKSGVSGARDVRAQALACGILDLDLGPLDLDLLGLQVHLDEVVLNIVAAPGPGNLLGNLLCAVTGLFDGAGALALIAQLLNAILALLP